MTLINDWKIRNTINDDDQTSRHRSPSSTSVLKSPQQIVHVAGIKFAVDLCNLIFARRNSNLALNGHLQYMEIITHSDFHRNCRFFPFPPTNSLIDFSGSWETRIAVKVEKLFCMELCVWKLKIYVDGRFDVKLKCKLRNERKSFDFNFMDHWLLIILNQSFL